MLNLLLCHACQNHGMSVCLLMVAGAFFYLTQSVREKVSHSELHKESEEVVVRRTLRRLDRYFRELEKKASQQNSGLGIPESEATLTRVNPLLSRALAYESAKPVSAAEPSISPQAIVTNSTPTPPDQVAPPLPPQPVAAPPLPPQPVAAPLPPPQPVAAPLPPPQPAAAPPPPPLPVAPVVKVSPPPAAPNKTNAQKSEDAKPSPKVTVQLRAPVKPEPAAPQKNKQPPPPVQESGEFSEKNDTDSRVDLLFTEKKPPAPPSYNAFLFALAAGIVALGIYLALSWYL